MLCSQGRQFVGLAESFGPHLGYLIAPALEALQPQIQAVAAAVSAQQEMRRRSVSCALPPVEQLTVHDSAESLTRLPSRFGPGGQQARSRTPAPAGQQSAQRMLSPFQTYSAPAVVSPQGSLAEAQSTEAQPSGQQTEKSGSGGSGRLDLSPAKTALDMSLLDVAKLGSPYRPQPRAAPDSVPQRGSGEAHRRLSAGESQTVAKVAETADNIPRRSTHSRELEMEAQASTELSAGPHELVIVSSNRGRPHRRPPLPLMRASSPLAMHGSEASTGSMPRQMSIHLPESFSLAKQRSGDRSPSKASQDTARHWESFQKGFDNVATAHKPIATATSGGSTGGFTSPFASSQPSGDFPDADEPQSAASIATTVSSLMQEGSVINMDSILPPQAGQQQQQLSSPHSLCPLAVASLGASLPPAISTPAMAVLSAPVQALQPATFGPGLSGMTVPTLPLTATTSMQAPAPPQHSLSAASSYTEQRQDSQQTGYRLPPKLHSSSLLLQLLPAGSAQSLTALMSRQASGGSVGDARPISRSSSLTNDCSTSVSLSSPKRSLLNMSRAVSEQLHLAPGSKGVQRPFLADLQQRWTAGTQVSLRRTAAASVCHSSDCCVVRHYKTVQCNMMQQADATQCTTVVHCRPSCVLHHSLASHIATSSGRASCAQCISVCSVAGEAFLFKPQLQFLDMSCRLMGA